jgi:hypothetical protein
MKKMMMTMKMTIEKNAALHMIETTYATSDTSPVCKNVNAKMRVVATSSHPSSSYCLRLVGSA